MTHDRAKELIRRWSEKLACTAPEAFDWKVGELAKELQYVVEHGDGPGRHPDPSDFAYCADCTERHLRWLEGDTSAASDSGRDEKR